MRKLIKIMFLAGLVSTLTACEDQNNYQYLVTHPVVLKKKMDACAELSAAASNQEKQQCEIVTSATKKFMTLLAEQQIDAEKFGVRVLKAQSDYADAEVKVKQLEDDLAKANRSVTDATTIQKWEDELVVAKKDRDEKHFEVRMLLAVVGVSAPN